MARAHVMRPITSDTGDLLYGATVTVHEAGLSVNIGQPLYAGPTGTETLPNPYTATSGVIDFWLDVPQRVSVLAQRAGHSDILVYLDAAPPPEETATTEDPLLIVGPQVPGAVLMAGDVAGQARWGAAPTSSGITPLVTVLTETFSLGRDPAGWAFTQAGTTQRSYEAQAPEGRDLTTSLHAKHTGNAGSLAAVSPGFTLTEPGYVSLWLRPSLAAGENVVIAVTTQGGARTVLQTITDSRDWGFYRYPLAAGTYRSLAVEFNGAAVFSGTAGHEMWVTGIRAQYGGQVPAHTHTGSGAGSVQLGAAAEASGVNSVAVGSTARATGTDAVALGRRAQASAATAVAVGSQALAPSTDALALGARSSGAVAATGWIAAGADTYVDATDGVAVGRSAKTYGQGGAAVGAQAYVGPGATNGVALGQGAQALAPYSLALGAGAMVPATHAGATAVGQGAVSGAPSQLTLGNAATSMRAVVAVNRFYAVGPVNIGTDSTSRLGFYGSEGTVKPVVTGSDGGNLALRNLLGALAGVGLITNNTTN